MTILSKIEREQSIWVPPVTRTVSVPITTVNNRVWLPIGRQTRYVLPAGWKASLVAFSTGLGATVTPGVRIVNGRREVWYPFVYNNRIVSFSVETSELSPAEYTTRYEESTVTLVPGYWQSQESAPSWAHSAESIPRGKPTWEMRFKVPATVEGVVVGSSRVDSVSGTDARWRIAQGFYLHSGERPLLWSTRPLPEGLEMELLEPLPAWTTDTQFKLRSDGVRVTWFMDDVPVARAGDVLSEDRVMVSAALYGPFDTVVDAEFDVDESAEANAEIMVQPLVLIGDPIDSIRAEFSCTLYAHNYRNSMRGPLVPNLRASERGQWANMRHALEPFVLALASVGRSGSAAHLRVTPYFGAHGYPAGTAFGMMRVSPFFRAEVAGPANVDTGAALFEVVQPSVDTNPHGLVHGAGRLSGTFATSVRREHRVRALLRARAPMLSNRRVYQIITQTLGISTEADPGLLLDGRLVEAVRGDSHLIIGALFDVSVLEPLEGLATLQGQGLLEARLREALGISPHISIQAALQAHMQELLGVAVVKDLGQPGTVWSVTARGAEDEESTNYTDYPFTAFAQIGQSYFGASAQGLFELEGATDAGERVQAAIHLGERDFGTNKIKRLDNAYVSTNAASPLRLRVGSEGQQYTYATRGASPKMRTQRFDLGRGLRGHFFELEILNADGAAFELDGIEFAAQESGRRI